jgi:hypothetical protein
MAKQHCFPKRWLVFVGAICLGFFLAATNAEEKPSLGWVRMFNGRDLSGWKIRDPKAGPTWKVVKSAQLDPTNPKRLVGEGVGGSLDAVLLRVPVEQGTDIISERSYSDCELHLEFMNAKESNSGIFLMGRYEVQICDSFGIPENKLAAGECGGILWLKAPTTNACKAPGEWQTCDIVFRAPRFNPAGKKTESAKIVSVILNGKKVQENVEVPEPTGGELDGGEVPTGPILLQGNEGVVAYRNIRVKAAPGK